MTYLRVFWLGVYVVAAIVAAVLFGSREMLGGDTVDIPLPSFAILITAVICVAASYLLWMGVVYRKLEKISISPFISKWRSTGLPTDDKPISIFVFVLQCSFMAYCLFNGVGTAGSVKSADSPIKYIWILLPADVIFVIYYSIYRQSKWFKFNLVLYVCSNMLRGWLGFWLIVLFLEGSFRIREKKLNIKKTVFVVGFFIYLVPFLIEIKWAIRKFGNSYILNTENFLSVFKNVKWFESATHVAESILFRLQHLDIVIVIINNATFLSEKLRARDFLYFFEEGLPQYTLERLLGWERVADIHIKLIDYFAVYPAGKGAISNTHTGLVGWLWIAPTWGIAYLVYVLMLTWGGIWLGKKLGATGGILDLVWFAVLVWVMNGWFGAYIEFLQALFLFIIIRILLDRSNEKPSMS